MSPSLPGSPDLSPGFSGLSGHSGTRSLISVIPLAILGVLAYTRALALVGADQTTAAEVVGGLKVLILFILAVGIFSAVGLAGFAAHSVADPPGRVEAAMAAVGRGDLYHRCPVLANDEIGAVAEGFNRMVEGLREREVIREVQPRE